MDSLISPQGSNWFPGKQSSLLSPQSQTWCGLDYRWRNLEGANKPHVLGQWERMQGGHQGGGSEWALDSFPTLSLDLIFYAMALTIPLHS